MKKNVFRIVIPEDLIDDFLATAKENQIICSTPQPADGDVEPLNAPITGSELINVAQIITAVFSAGTAGIVFFLKLKELLKKSKKTIRVIDSANNVDLTISGNIDDDSIRRLFRDV